MAEVLVPANLLLLGEYAVLEPGGLGVTVACKPEASAAVAAATRLEVVGIWGGGRSVWPEDGSESLFSCVVDAVATVSGYARQEVGRIPLRLTVDTTPFYSPQPGPAGHGKQGFGSSAAASVAVCYALLEWLQGLEAGTRDTQSKHSIGLPSEAGRATALSGLTFTAALAAHRAFQGGRGSGYDVAASVYGGIGLFSGGEKPSFERRPLPWLPPLLLFRGESPVLTAGAVARYEAWKARHPAEAHGFLRESNSFVERFVGAQDWNEAARWFVAARALGIELGDAIGVPARIDPPPHVHGLANKAIGAGNELGVAVLGPLEAGRQPEPSAQLVVPIAGARMTGARESEAR